MLGTPYHDSLPHVYAQGDGNDSVPIIKKIGVLLPDTVSKDSSGKETHTDTLSASEARRKHRLRSRYGHPSKGTLSQAFSGVSSSYAQGLSNALFDLPMSLICSTTRITGRSQDRLWSKRDGS